MIWWLAVFVSAAVICIIAAVKDKSRQRRESRRDYAIDYMNNPIVKHFEDRDKL
jgi:hypothetical protein